MIRSSMVHKVPLIVMLLDIALVSSFLIAPYSIPHGEVIGLEGRANAMDFQERWRDLDLFPRIIYSFGDLNCHQKVERSLVLNGNQLPLCARDVAIFAGLMLGAILLIRANASDDPSRTFISIFPKRLRAGTMEKHPTLTFLLFLFLLALPTAIDGGVQMLSTLGALPFGLSYESTNPTRLITGFPVGIAAGLLVTALLMSLFSRRETGEKALAWLLASGGK